MNLNAAITVTHLTYGVLQEFMSVKDRYIRSIGSLIESAAQRPNSPAGLRAQQLAREAVVLTFYACFLSPRKLCRASAFNYATKEASSSDDPSVWAAVMVSFLENCAFSFDNATREASRDHDPSFWAAPS